MDKKGVESLNKLCGFCDFVVLCSLLLRFGLGENMFFSKIKNVFFSDNKEATRVRFSRNFENKEATRVLSSSIA
jgi:hypothetical protein